MNEIRPSPEALALALELTSERGRTGPTEYRIKLALALDAFRATLRKPWCETCGCDVEEVLCPYCAKWWGANNPDLDQPGDALAHDMPPLPENNNTRPTTPHPSDNYTPSPAAQAAISEWWESQQPTLGGNMRSKLGWAIDRRMVARLPVEICSMTNPTITDADRNAARKWLGPNAAESEVASLAQAFGIAYMAGQLAGAKAMQEAAKDACTQIAADNGEDGKWDAVACDCAVAVERIDPAQVVKEMK